MIRNTIESLWHNAVIRYFLILGTLAWAPVYFLSLAKASLVN